MNDKEQEIWPNRSDSPNENLPSFHRPVEKRRVMNNINQIYQDHDHPYGYIGEGFYSSIL